MRLEPQEKARDKPGIKSEIAFFFSDLQESTILAAEKLVSIETTIEEMKKSPRIPSSVTVHFLSFKCKGTQGHRCGALVHHMISSGEKQCPCLQSLYQLLEETINEKSQVLFSLFIVQSFK